MMGQAKQRGTFEQRKAEAIERNRIAEIERKKQELAFRNSAEGQRRAKANHKLLSIISLAAGLSMPLLEVNDEEI